MASKPGLFYDILPAPQRDLWPRLRATPRNFVLYGGTAIALRLGHRKSEDFDFFSAEPFSPSDLRAAIPYLRDARVEQVADNTLTCLVGEAPSSVSLSFFGGLGSRMRSVHAPDVADNGVQIASLLDLAATKAAVVQRRASLKDYLDVAAIIESGMPLVEHLSAAAGVFGTADFNPLLTLKALAYHDDPELRELPRNVRETLTRAVKETDMSKIRVPKSHSRLSAAGKQR